MDVELIEALLIAPRSALFPSGGGVQAAGRDYADVLEAAGFRLHRLPFETGNSLSTRLLNRLFPRVMVVDQPLGLAAEIEKSLARYSAKFVFFYPALFPALSRRLRRESPAVKQLLLSVGVESIDFCIDQQIRRGTGTENRARSRAERMLGRQLLDEAEQRSLIDGVLTLSPLEVEVEKWLGAPRAFWVPRTVRREPIEANPLDGRVGCVSTLDHPPNREGLVRLLNALSGQAPPEFRFRLIGQQVSEGRALAAQFPIVEYLGPLDDDQLRSEAATWCCFVHPLFVYAKGCSTKLSIGLGWGLPVATTEYGARGYLWDPAVLPLSITAAELAESVIVRSRTASFAEFQEQTRRIVARMPTIDAAAVELRQFLTGDAHV